MKKLLLMVLSILILNALQGQNVGIGTTSPKPSAQLDISSTNKGLLIPRMTSAQRNAIPNPEFGLMVFDTEIGTIMLFDGQFWRTLTLGDENTNHNVERIPKEGKVYDKMGISVAMDGNYSIIGSPYFSSGSMSFSGIAHIYQKENNIWIQRARLAAPDSSENSLFGYSVAISGDYAVVGAPSKKVNNITSGKVYIYKRTGNNWNLETSYTIPEPKNNDAFGYSVGINANTSGGIFVAVGSPFSAYSGTQKGETYLFRKNGNIWSLYQTLRPDNLSNYDYFGSDISISGDILAISAPNQINRTNPSSPVAGAGAVYMYVLGGGYYTLQQRISGGMINAKFGTSISLKNDEIAISAPHHTIYSNTTPTVYFYKKNVSNWVYQSKIEMDIKQLERKGLNPIYFGLSVAYDGKNLLISAPGAIDKLNQYTINDNYPEGTVYIYEKDSYNRFHLIKYIKGRNDMLNNDFFGISTAISNGNYVISNSRGNLGSNIEVGGVVFGVIK